MRHAAFTATSIIAAALLAGDVPSDEPDHRAATTELVGILQTGLQATRAETADTPETLARLQAAVRSGLEQIPAQSPVAVRLKAALERDGTPQTQLARLKTVVQTAVEQLSFVPVHEADQPQGFPPYTPAGLLEVKQYPAYRMAVASGFWTLFLHIKSNNIAMTAPVEMTYAGTDGDTLTQSSMSFLYGRPDLGSAGPNGAVDVVDVPPATVIALGIRGPRTRESDRRARAVLKDWLEAHPEYTPDGAFRIMGYNSPYVPDEQQFREAQQIIRKRDEPTSAPGS